MQKLRNLTLRILNGDIPAPMERTMTRVFGSLYTDHARFWFLRLCMWLLPRRPWNWNTRITDALAAPDNAWIPRVADAGKVRNNRQIMHNGLVVGVASYYGLPVTLMLNRNRGVHEPQEERVFGEVLRHVRPGAVMMELGAYWGFYSMWFQQAIPGSAAWLVEPELEHLELGRANLRLNGFSGTFVQAFVGSEPGYDPGGRRIVSVDSLAAEHGIEHIDILHSDIQGAEYDMLIGASRCFREQRIAYVFISTHSDELHEKCIAFLEQQRFSIIAAADLAQTYSLDGLIAARAPWISHPEAVSIALRRVPVLSVK